MIAVVEWIAIHRAEEQMEAGVWRVDDPASDGWLPRRVAYCRKCGQRRDCDSPSLCPACRLRARRVHCWACNDPAEVHGYCRVHREQVRSSGVVDSLHIGRHEAAGAPKGRGMRGFSFGKGIR